MSGCLQRYDVIVCVDTLIYFGELLPAFRRATTASGGRFAFSVEEEVDATPRRVSSLTASGATLTPKRTCDERCVGGIHAAFLSHEGLRLECLRWVAGLVVGFAIKQQDIMAGSDSTSTSAAGASRDFTRGDDSDADLLLADFSGRGLPTRPAGEAGDGAPRRARRRVRTSCAGGRRLTPRRRWDGCAHRARASELDAFHPDSLYQRVPTFQRLRAAPRLVIRDAPTRSPS